MRTRKTETSQKMTSLPACTIPRDIWTGPLTMASQWARDLGRLSTATVRSQDLEVTRFPGSTPKEQEAIWAGRQNRRRNRMVQLTTSTDTIPFRIQWPESPLNSVSPKEDETKRRTELQQTILSSSTRQSVRRQGIVTRWEPPSGSLT